MSIRKRSKSVSFGEVSAQTKVLRSDAVAAYPKLGLADLMSLVECPICITVPRAGVMLMCINGHNVCAVCKKKLGRKAKCPLGRCKFNRPPTKNFTVSNLVEKFPFVWPCKYQKQMSCQFEGTKAALETHETDCPMIKCPHYECEETVSLSAVVNHLKRVHEQTAYEVGNSGGTGWFSLNPNLRHGCPWPVVPIKLESLSWGLLSSHWHKCQLFVWVWGLLDEDEADKLQCSLEVGDNRTTKMVFNPPVFPLAWDRQKVVGDERCARVCASNFEDLITADKVTDKLRSQGYTAVLWVSLNVVKKGLNMAL